MIDYSCVVCGASTPAASRWVRIRAWASGWYEMKDGTVFCPDHRPPFAADPKPKVERAREPREQRRICWPDPDATCLEGGCAYCNSYPFRNVSTIRRYAKSARVLRNRAVGEKPAMEAFAFGEAHRWGNAESRIL